MCHEGRWRAAIGALTAPTYIGGLGSYQRGLAEALEDFGVEGVFVSVFPKHPALGMSENPDAVAGEVWIPPATWTKISEIMMRLAARPVLHPALEFMVSTALPVRSLSKLVGKVDWVHFVGTGRDYLGFALMRFARRAGVRFTVWPAVHPRDWGDDVLDVRLYERPTRSCARRPTNSGTWRIWEFRIASFFLCGLPAMCLADGNADSIRRELDLGNRPCVLFLGRRDEGKGYFALLQAWPHRPAGSAGCLSSPGWSRRSASGRLGQIAARFVSRSGTCQRADQGRRARGLRPFLSSVQPRVLRHRLRGSMVLRQAGHLRHRAGVQRID